VFHHVQTFQFRRRTLSLIHLYQQHSVHMRTAQWKPFDFFQSGAEVMLDRRGLTCVDGRCLSVVDCREALG